MGIALQDFEEIELVEWGLSPQKKNNYSRKIEAPVYEPTMDVAPSITDCVNTEKYESLLSEIAEADISDDDREFLKLAAARHIRFDYKNIAERYAHADANVQKLMENSALVIIDFGAAIENGFVKMTELLMNTIKNDTE